MGAESEKEAAVLSARIEDEARHFEAQIAKLEQAEQRLAENFERLAGKIFEQRSEKLSHLNREQLDTLLKPLGEKLTEFRATVESSHRAETAQHVGSDRLVAVPQVEGEEAVIVVDVQRRDLGGCRPQRLEGAVLLGPGEADGPVFRGQKIELGAPAHAAGYGKSCSFVFKLLLNQLHDA